MDIAEQEDEQLHLAVRRARILFRHRGLLTTYACTCPAPNVEPSEVGVRCYGCGANAAWPGGS